MQSILTLTCSDRGQFRSLPDRTKSPRLYDMRDDDRTGQADSKSGLRPLRSLSRRMAPVLTAGQILHTSHGYSVYRAPRKTRCGAGVPRDAQPRKDTIARVAGTSTAIECTECKCTHPTPYTHSVLRTWLVTRGAAISRSNFPFSPKAESCALLHMAHPLACSHSSFPVRSGEILKQVTSSRHATRYCTRCRFNAVAPMDGSQRRRLAPSFLFFAFLPLALRRVSVPV